MFILVLDVLLIGEIMNDYLLTGEHIILASASAGVLALHERLSRGPHIGQLPPRAIQGCPGAIWLHQMVEALVQDLNMIVGRLVEEEQERNVFMVYVLVGSAGMHA